MAFETVLEDLTKGESIDANKILSELLNAKDIDLKTHICSPVDFAILDALIRNLEPMVFLNSKKKNKFQSDFLLSLKKFLVSWNRLSRKEITDTLKATKEQEIADRSLFNKLTGMG